MIFDFVFLQLTNYHFRKQDIQIAIDLNFQMNLYIFRFLTWSSKSTWMVFYRQNNYHFSYQHIQITSTFKKGRKNLSPKVHQCRFFCHFEIYRFHPIFHPPSQNLGRLRMRVKILNSQVSASKFLREFLVQSNRPELS